VDRLTLSAYYGRDVFYFDLDDEEQGFVLDMDWGNYTSSLQWRHVPNSKIVSLFSVAKTNYDWDLTLSMTLTDTATANETTTDILEKIVLQDWTAKEQLDWYASDEHTITTGFEFKILEMTVDVAANGLSLMERRQSPYILSLFLQDKWQPSALLSLQGGLRLTRYEIHDKFYFEPRLGFKYLLTENLALKASWGIYKQFIFADANDEEIISFVDLWLPIPKSHDAQSTQHYIIGMEHWLGDGFFASVEAYYKPYDNTLDTNPNSDPGDDDDDFIAGTGKAYGLELLIKKNTGRFSGWLGYTYSRLEKKIDFNSDGTIRKSDGEIYYPKYDRPHNFNAVFNYQLNVKNSFGLVISANSGQPYTPVEGKVFSQADWGSYTHPYSNLLDIYGRRNSQRYPPYFRMDVSWVRSIHPFGVDGKFKFQVLNVTNHFNTLFYQWNHTDAPSSVTAYSMFPILPTFGVEFKF
ncbi:MAG: TonB-dependent receptor, partial [Candidatus Neomarinimicrobiota bacterium]